MTGTNFSRIQRWNRLTVWHLEPNVISHQLLNEWTTSTRNSRQAGYFQSRRARFHSVLSCLSGMEKWGLQVQDICIGSKKHNNNWFESCALRYSLATEDRSSGKEELGRACWGGRLWSLHHIPCQINSKATGPGQGGVHLWSKHIITRKLNILLPSRTPYKSMLYQLSLRNFSSCRICE